MGCFFDDSCLKFDGVGQCTKIQTILQILSSSRLLPVRERNVRPLLF